MRTRDARVAPVRGKLEQRLADEARFFGAWLDSPKSMGAVSPSGRFLARAMARCVDPASDGLIVELGPGTGPVTEALAARGVAPERLVLVEYDGAFCKLLERRFPQAQVIRGDAYRLRDTLSAFGGRKISAVVSSLPLLTRPDADRIALLDDAFALMGPEGAFIQFTYGLVSPMPLKFNLRATQAYRGAVSNPVWLNLPPARVWRYTRADATATQVIAHLRPRHDKPAPFEAFRRKQVEPALALLRKIADGPRDGRR